MMVLRSTKKPHDVLCNQESIYFQKLASYLKVSGVSVFTNLDITYSVTHRKISPTFGFSIKIKVVEGEMSINGNLCNWKDF